MAAGLRHYEAAQRSLQGGHCVLNWGLDRHLSEIKIEHQSLLVLAHPKGHLISKAIYGLLISPKK